MTDLEISAQLAERVHGWKIAPTEEDERWDWFTQRSNYPCFDPCRGAAHRNCRNHTPWSPLTDWNAAMGLAEKWMDSTAGNWYDLERLPVHGYHVYLFPSDDELGAYSAIDQSGPRAVCLALAKAMGIEVGK